MPYNLYMKIEQLANRQHKVPDFNHTTPLHLRSEAISARFHLI
jgi:hypothetical protein